MLLAAQSFCWLELNETVRKELSQNLERTGALARSSSQMMETVFSSEFDVKGDAPNRYPRTVDYERYAR